MTQLFQTRRISSNNFLTLTLKRPTMMSWCSTRTRMLTLIYKNYHGCFVCTIIIPLWICRRFRLVSGRTTAMLQLLEKTLLSIKRFFSFEYPLRKSFTVYITCGFFVCIKCSYSSNSDGKKKID